MVGADGTPGHVHSRYTHVFDTDGGAWRLRSAQGTPISSRPADEPPGRMRAPALIVINVEPSAGTGGVP